MNKLGYFGAEIIGQCVFLPFFSLTSPFIPFLSSLLIYEKSQWENLAFLFLLILVVQTTSLLPGLR